MSVALERMPPHSPDAELAVIGSILIDPDAVGRALEFVEADDFYQEAHRTIFEVAVDLFNQTKPIDVVVVGEELRRRGKLDAVGGLAYLMEVAGMVPTAAHVEYYARLVRDNATLRKVIATATTLVTRAYAAEDSPQELLDHAQQSFFQLARRGQQEVVPLHDVLVDTFTRLEAVYENKGRLVGLPTGFPDLDRMTAGLQRSELVVVAARPSMGKTQFMLNVARYLAVHENVPVVIFSLEMSREQLALRLLSAEAEVEGHRLRTGELDADMWQRLSLALGRLGSAPIYIDDSPGLMVLELRAKARHLKAQIDVGLVMVDYLQLLQGRRAENRQQEISDISRSLKAVARELQIPVVALSQLSRAVEARPNKRPMLSDLRESGAIEQDADVVAFLYREDYYNKEAERPDLTEFIVAKQRNGPTGTVQLLFQKDTGRFVSVTGLAPG